MDWKWWHGEMIFMCDVWCTWHVVSLEKSEATNILISKKSCGLVGFLAYPLGGPMYQNYNYYMHLGCQKVTPFPYPVRHWWSEEVWSLWRALWQRGHSLLLCSKLYSKDIFQRVEYECMNVNTGLKKTSLATLDSWRTVVPSRAKWPTWPLFEGGALARLPDAVMLSTFYRWVLADDFKTSPHPVAGASWKAGIQVPGARSHTAAWMNFLKWKIKNPSQIVKDVSQKGWFL